MSLSINQAPGFNQQQYDSLINQAASEKVDTGLVNELLLNAISKGKSFDQAVGMVGAQLPKLAEPAFASRAQLSGWPGLPSPGAMIMSATTQFAAEQRRQNQEVAFAETQSIVASMKNEADDMRSTAAKQLAMGMVSAAIQIGVGLAQLGVSVSAASNAAKAASEASKAATAAGKTAAQVSDASMTASQGILGQANSTSQIIGALGGGLGKVVDSCSQYVGTAAQARWKEMQADQEQMRSMRDSIKSLNDALADLIRKSLAAQSDIQANTNQTRTKILA